MELPDKSLPPSVTTPPVQRPKVEQVATGKLVKRPASRRFKDFLLADSPKTLIANIAVNTLWPRGKAVVEAGLHELIAGLFWSNGQRPAGGVGMIASPMLRAVGQQYTGIPQVNNPMALANQAVQTRSGGEYQDVTFPTLEQAEAVLASLYADIQQYHRVAIGDLYERAGIRTLGADNGYGWLNIDSARITKTRDGFVLELPRPVYIL